MHHLDVRIRGLALVAPDTDRCPAPSGVPPIAVGAGIEPTRVQALLDACAPHLVGGEAVLGIALLSDETTPGELFVVVTTARIARLHVAGRVVFVGEWAADVASLSLLPVVVQRRDERAFVVGRLRAPGDADLIEFALWHHG